MNNIQSNYQALVIEENDVPHESVIFHAASEGSKSHWTHIGDLDSFFKQVYNYHQKVGFRPIILSVGIELLVTISAVFIISFCPNCINFNFNSPSSVLYNVTHIEISDIISGLPVCASRFGLYTWFFIILGFIFILYKCYKLWYTVYTYIDIKNFFTIALKIISEDQLSSITWHEVQCRLREVQHEQQMCVHKSDLTELDICHRILRNKNYMIAMVNKNILPLKHNNKFLGEWIYLSSGLEYNIEFLLFGRFNSPFKETGKLKEDVKKYSKRKEVAAELQKWISWVAFINLTLSVFILIYQFMCNIIAYAGAAKFTPTHFSTRSWSRYARLYFRHYNEMDHGIQRRLIRAYKPAKEYMKSFSSPSITILCKFLAQICGFIAVFFFVWATFEEKLLQVNRVFVIVVVSTLGYYVFKGCIPKEDTIYYPNRQMKRMIGILHYLPDHFQENAHTFSVRDEFSQFYRYKFVDILEDLISPIVTPLILQFYLRPRALEIVDFLRNFTVDVAGVGDVCSFALMDVSRHGNQYWLSEGHTKADQHQQAEGGKTELSLLHFTLMNPHWKPPPTSDIFITDFRDRVNAAREGQDMNTQDPYFASLSSLSTMGSMYASLVNSIHGSVHRRTEGPSFLNLGGPVTDTLNCSKMTQAEGPAHLTQGLLTSFHGDLGPEVLCTDLNPLEIRTADMSFSALYMHEVHHRLMESSRSHSNQHPQSSQQPENHGNEESPLLDVRVVNYVQ